MKKACKKCKVLRITALLASLLGIVVLFNSARDLMPTDQQVTTTEGNSAADSSFNIEKPLNDTRDYHYITLENKLRVLLISDVNADKSAASLDVHVGSSDDPKDREGLAHFLEHMLFLGTEKYPEASAYQTFLSENGGDHNAYTSAEHTNYFFDIKPDKLGEALDRFAQFFIAPLFDEQYVDRERQVVHSEYQSKIKDDFRRSYDVYRQLINPDHPYSKFSVGSLETLADGENNNVRDDLLSFYEKHYSPQQMTLVVLGRETIAELESMVRQRFAAIPQRSAPEAIPNVPLFAAGTLPTEVTIAPIKDIRRMTMAFPLPAAKQYYAEKPLSYLGSLLGHEGKGSLLSVLKAQGWAESLAAGSNDSGAGNASFYLLMTLTEEGLKAREQIKALVFHALATIRTQGIEAWRYEEEKRLADIAFKYKEEGRAISLVRGLADRMHRYPIHQVLSANYLYQNFDAELIQSFLEKMTPDNLYVSLEYTGAETDNTTYHYSTPYSVRSLSLQLASIPDSLKQQYQLPTKNIFVPENSQLVKKDQRLSEPTFLATQNLEIVNTEILVKQDLDFQVPKASIHLRLKLPSVSYSLKGTALNELLLALVRDRINENSYPAEIAGLSYHLSPHNQGFDVSLSGYSDKMGILLNMITNELQAPTILQERFSIIKKELIRKLRNSQKQTPYRQLFSQFSSVLYKPSWTDTTIANTLEQLTLADIKTFSTQWLDGLQLQSLFYGNIDQTSIDNWASQLKTLVKPSDGEPKPSRVLKLSGTEALYNNISVDHDDKAVALYVQGLSDSIEDQAKMVLLRQIFEAPFYNQLRTEQQLGYIVFLTSMTIKNVPGSAFVVQSPQTPVKSIQEAIENFLNTSTDLIPDDLTTYKESAAAKLLERPKSLSAKARRYWHDLLKEQRDFAYRENLVKTIRQVSADELRQYHQQVLSNAKRRAWFTAAKNQEQTTTTDAQATYYVYP